MPKTKTTEGGECRIVNAMLNRFVTVAIFIPLAIILVALAVANRAPVAFTLDPFNPGNPGLTTTLPLFVYLFAALLVGLVIGSIATWLRQGRYRKSARKREADQTAERVRDKAAPMAQPGAGPALPRPSA